MSKLVLSSTRSLLKKKLPENVRESGRENEKEGEWKRVREKMKERKYLSILCNISEVLVLNELLK
jgi:hypothetical protein